MCFAVQKGAQHTIRNRSEHRNLVFVKDTEGADQRIVASLKYCFASGFTDCGQVQQSGSPITLLPTALYQSIGNHTVYEPHSARV